MEGGRGRARGEKGSVDSKGGRERKIVKVKKRDRMNKGGKGRY